MLGWLVNSVLLLGFKLSDWKIYYWSRRCCWESNQSHHLPKCICQIHVSKGRLFRRTFPLFNKSRFVQLFHMDCDDEGRMKKLFIEQKLSWGPQNNNNFIEKLETKCRLLFIKKFFASGLVRFKTCRCSRYSSGTATPVPTAQRTTTHFQSRVPGCRPIMKLKIASSSRHIQDIYPFCSHLRGPSKAMTTKLISSRICRASSTRRSFPTQFWGCYVATSFLSDLL